MISSFLRETFYILNESSIYLLIGFLFAGIIKLCFSSNKILITIRQKSFKSILIASLSGIPLPLCSCSVLPTAVALRKEGASKGATVSFLISTPETGIDSVGITWGLMDPLMTIYRPICALITSLFAGLATNFSDGSQEIPTQTPIPVMSSSIPLNNPSSTGFSRIRFWVLKIWNYAFVELMDDILVWLVAGFLLAGLISSLIPDSFFTNHVENGPLSMLVILAVSIPMYICASASTPIAAALVMKGLSPGAALVLLLAGPATNVATVPILMNILGKKVTLIYFVVIAVTSVGFGLLLNSIYDWLYAGEPVVFKIADESSLFGEGYSLTATGLFVFLMICSARRKLNSES